MNGETTMAVGTVKWFNTAKHYGFIIPETGGGDVFVHISAVEQAGLNTLQENQRLEYEMGEDKKGKPLAVNLSLLD